MTTTEAQSTWKDEQIKRLTEYSNEQKKEIERLKELLKQTLDKYLPFHSEHEWRQFKKENNL